MFMKAQSFFGAIRGGAARSALNIGAIVVEAWVCEPGLGG